MLAFEQTASGYKATDEQVAWWESRDTCPACAAVVEPTKTVLGVHHYMHDCDGYGVVRWTREVA